MTIDDQRRARDADAAARAGPNADDSGAALDADGAGEAALDADGAVGATLAALGSALGIGWTAPSAFTAAEDRSFIQWRAPAPTPIAMIAKPRTPSATDRLFPSGGLSRVRVFAERGPSFDARGVSFDALGVLFDARVAALDLRSVALIAGVDAGARGAAGRPGSDGGAPGGLNAGIPNAARASRGSPPGLEGGGTGSVVASTGSFFV